MVDKDRLDDPHVKANLLFQVRIIFFYYSELGGNHFSLFLMLSFSFCLLFVVHNFCYPGIFFSTRVANQRLRHGLKVCLGSKYTYYPGHDRYMC